MNATTQTIDTMIDVLRRRHFIIPDREDLLIISEHENTYGAFRSREFGSEYFGCAPFGFMEKASDIATAVDDCHVQFFRFDCQTNTVMEDVTEEIAIAFIDRLDHDDFEGMCEEDLPLFALSLGTYFSKRKDLLQAEYEADQDEWAKGPSHYFGVPAR